MWGKILVILRPDQFKLIFICFWILGSRIVNNKWNAKCEQKRCFFFSCGRQRPPSRQKNAQRSVLFCQPGNLTKLLEVLAIQYPLSRQVGWFSLTFPLRNSYLPCDLSMSELRPSLIYDLGQLCPVFFLYGMFSGLCSKVYKLQTPTAPYARFSFTPKAVFCQLILTTKANIAPNVTNIGWIWHGVGVWPTMFGLEKIRT